jgi:[ribosomal protein S18]-alanine N-acetyltransferase
MRPSPSLGRRPEGPGQSPMIFGLRRPSPPVIRLLRPDRADACARLHAEGFAHPWSAEEIAALIASSSTVGAAALDPVNGRLRGFVLSRLAADEAEILTIAVETAFQGKGVGRALLSENLRQASNAGAKAMFLEGQRAGFGFVRALRLRQSGRTRRLLPPQGRNARRSGRHAQGARMRWPRRVRMLNT